MRFRDFILREMGGEASTASLGVDPYFGFSSLPNPRYMDTGGRFSSVVGRGNLIVQPILFFMRRFAHFAINVRAFQENLQSGQAQGQYDTNVFPYLKDIDTIQSPEAVTGIPEQAMKLPTGGALNPDEIHKALQGISFDDPVMPGKKITFPPFLRQEQTRSDGSPRYTLLTGELKNQIDQLEQIQYRAGNIGGMIDTGLGKFWQQASDPGIAKLHTGLSTKY